MVRAEQLAAGATRLVATGVVGVVVVRTAEELVRSGQFRRLAVGGTRSGIRAGRWLARSAEEARLAMGDVVAEAYSSMGETAPPPVEGAGHAHDHG